MSQHINTKSKHKQLLTNNYVDKSPNQNEKNCLQTTMFKSPNQNEIV